MIRVQQYQHIVLLLNENQLMINLNKSSISNISIIQIYVRCVLYYTRIVE